MISSLAVFYNQHRNDIYFPCLKCFFWKLFLFQLVFRSTGIKTCQFFILCPAITVRLLLLVGDPGCCVVGIPDTLDLVYTSVHTPDINPQHLQTQSLSVSDQKTAFLKLLAVFPWREHHYFSLCVLSFILKVSLSGLFIRIILFMRPHIPTADCLSSIFCSTLHHIANRWITFLAPELCTNISRLQERGGIKNVTARALEATSPFPWANAGWLVF